MIVYIFLNRIVFPSRKKTKKATEIVHKKYILATETFEFGPLLNSRPRTGLVKYLNKKTQIHNCQI